MSSATVASRALKEALPPRLVATVTAKSLVSAIHTAGVKDPGLPEAVRVLAGERMEVVGGHGVVIWPAAAQLDK